MKVQSQFQSQVQSVVKKDDTKVSDNQAIFSFCFNIIENLCMYNFKNLVVCIAE